MDAFFPIELLAVFAVYDLHCLRRFGTVTAARRYAAVDATVAAPAASVVLLVPFCFVGFTIAVDNCIEDFSGELPLQQFAW